MTRINVLFLVFMFAHISLISQSTDCLRTAKFGTTDICIPDVKGYEECYLNPEVKLFADATEAPVNMVLGYYINDESYAVYDTIDILNDFFKIYGTKEIQNLPANKEVITEMGSMLKGNFLIKNWDEMTKYVEDSGLDVEVGVPTVVKSYNLNEESFTMLMIIKYDIAGFEPYDMCIAMNGFLSNDRMVWMAYYLIYDGEETMNKVESKSNEILSSLQKAS